MHVPQKEAIQTHLGRRVVAVVEEAAVVVCPADAGELDPLELVKEIVTSVC